MAQKFETGLGLKGSVVQKSRGRPRQSDSKKAADLIQLPFWHERIVGLMVGQDELPWLTGGVFEFIALLVAGSKERNLISCVIQIHRHSMTYQIVFEPPAGICPIEVKDHARLL